jgi:hypothetical protein
LFDAYEQQTGKIIIVRYDINKKPIIQEQTGNEMYALNINDENSYELYNIQGDILTDNDYKNEFINRLIELMVNDKLTINGDNGSYDFFKNNLIIPKKDYVAELKNFKSKRAEILRNYTAEARPSGLPGPRQNDAPTRRAKPAWSQPCCGGQTPRFTRSVP